MFLSGATLPSVAPDMRKDIGNISSVLWAAIKEGRCESYPRLAQGLRLADRILVKTLHVHESGILSDSWRTRDAPARQRETMKIEYEEGRPEGALAEHILKSLSGDNVAAKVQWSIEVEVEGARQKGRKLVEEDDDHDDLQKMFRLGVQGFPDLDIHGSTPFITTRSGAWQANPLALMRIDDLKPWYVSAGRLVGSALWTSKTIGVPMARFFARRVLELARTERLVAFSSDGDGPPFFDATIQLRSHHVDFTGCPLPHLDMSGFGSAHRVVDACTHKGQFFLKCQRSGPVVHGAGGFGFGGFGFGRPAGAPPSGALGGQEGEPGWIMASQTTAEAKSEEEVRQKWAEVKRLGQKRTFNGTFFPAGPRAIRGQACRVSKLLMVPVFKNVDDERKNKSLEELAHDKEEEDAKITRRLLEAQDEAYARAIGDGLSEADCERVAQTAVQKVFAAIEAEKAKTSSAASCQASPLLASEHPQTLLLGSNVFSCKMQGYAFLPAWAMQALGIKDGEEVSVEALPLPLNKAGRAMQLSSQGSWHCSLKMTQGKCAPGKACADCQAVASPELGCGLPLAARVCWRLPNHHLTGEVEHILGSHMQTADFFAKRNLWCLKAGVAIPIEWSGSTVFISAENIVDGDARALGEAAIASHTEHVLLPPLDAPLVAPLPVQGEADGKAGQAKGRWRMVYSAIKAARLLGSSTDDALMTSEMLLDYLEQAARDEIDRDHIKRNEFGWLMKHKIEGLDEDGTLPPRFSGLAGGGMKRQISLVMHPNKRRKDERSDALSAAGVDPQTDPELAPAIAESMKMDMAGAGGGGAAVASSVVEKEYYSTLAQAPESAVEAVDLSEKGKRDLLRRWLRRKLYEEVQEQAYAFSRGLREIIPLGVLELFSVEELQAMLGSGPAVSNVALADWKRHTEYDNGLDESSERVKWFWEAVSGMSPAARANVWRYATGRTIPPPQSEGGCGALEPKFNLVDRGSGEEEDQALITAATCHRQLRLPRYSSAQVTSRQLALSVEQGLASTEDAEGFETVQRRLMAKVQEEMAKLASSGQKEQETKVMLRKLFPNSYMCGKCNFGPVDHTACANLRSHHGAMGRGGSRISNACPKCGWFSENLSDWPPWDGRVW